MAAADRCTDIPIESCCAIQLLPRPACTPPHLHARSCDQTGEGRREEGGQGGVVLWSKKLSLKEREKEETEGKKREMSKEM